MGQAGSCGQGFELRRNHPRLRGVGEGNVDPGQEAGGDGDVAPSSYGAEIVFESLIFRER